MQNGSTNLILQKRAAGEKAVEFIESKMVVGLGTGSTVKFMIEKLAEKVKEGLDISAVSTSYKTTLLAKSLGINVIDLKEVEIIDLTIDGADEIDPELNGIKGGGGALLYEKIVAVSSIKNIWIVDSTKYVERLGNFPLPIEVLQFGSEKTFTKFSSLGYKPKFRMNGERYFVTDGGNYTIDLILNDIDNPFILEKELKLIPGVVETGLFLNLCDVAIIGRDSDCEIIINDKKRPVIRNDRP
jgi:ribose 5-phosphate isomerase A